MADPNRQMFTFPKPPGLASVPTRQRLTPRAALHLAGRAVEYLLTGQPGAATFEPADLEQALVLLRQMGETIRPVYVKVTAAFPQSKSSHDDRSE